MTEQVTKIILDGSPFWLSRATNKDIDFKMGINKDKFWDTEHNTHPALTDAMVKSAEAKLGVKLPNRFIELLKIQNGGYTKGFAFPMTQKTTWSENHVPLSDLFGIIVDKDTESFQNIMQTEYMTKEWGLPEKQVLLTGDGHWWITLDYRTGDNPVIMWIDVECNEAIKIADNFDQFVDGLVSDNTFC